jgi:hypothetical protein
MELRLNADDCARLRPETLAQVLRELGLYAPGLGSRAPEASDGSPNNPQDSWTEEWNFTNVADLTVPQIRDFIRGYEQVESALRLFAEHGPVLDARLLANVGVVDDPTGEERGWDGVIAISSFQRNMTKRVRTVTGNKMAFLFTWGPWEHDSEGRLTSGQYVVSPATFRALRKYFDLQD